MNLPDNILSDLGSKYSLLIYIIHPIIIKTWGLLFKENLFFLANNIFFVFSMSLIISILIRRFSLRGYNILNGNFN